MAVQSRLSLTNHIATATVSVSTSQAADWPWVNARAPQAPYRPGRSASVVNNFTLEYDLGAAKLIELVLYVNVNFTVVDTIALADASAGADHLSGPLTIARNPWNRRYTLCYMPSTPQTRRYVRIQMDGPTTDSTTAFSIGGVWAGPLTALPTDIRWDERPHIMEPSIDTPLLGGGTQRVSVGRPLVQLSAQRLAMTEIDHPATGDDLGTWLEIDRQMVEAGHFAWYFNRGNTAEAFIVRKMNESDWPVNQIMSEDALILHEVVGP